MALLENQVSGIQKVLLPAVWSIKDISRQVSVFHLAAEQEQLVGTLSVTRSWHGEPTEFMLSLPGDDTVMITRYTSDSLFLRAPRVLQSDSAVVDGDVLIPSSTSKWLRHPDLDTCDVLQIADLARKSWDGCLNFSQEERDLNGLIVRNGLRSPQIGALHAIAAHWSVSKRSALIVMPTGTGKTEVMIAAMMISRPRRLLVLVPSDALRSQTVKKFIQLGILAKIQAIPEKTIRPVVGMVTGTPQTEGHLSSLDKCNVVITTVAAIQRTSEEHLSNFLKKFDAVFFDEAHHVPATSWELIFDKLKEQMVLLFTATPFRLDGQRIPGKIIYNFPLRLAQEQKYFRPIKFLEIFDPDPETADIQIADQAVGQLRADLAAGRNHQLLARFTTIERAESVFKTIYEKKYPDLSPTIIYTGVRQRRQRLHDFQKGKHKIAVCVDMFGEGFDLPSLKIAAIHDPHKSLAITLQFAGRFTRDSKENIGDATIVANTADPKVSDAIEELYAEDSDWNVLIPALSAKAIQSQIDFSEFLDKMVDHKEQQGDVFGLNVLRPKTSTLVFKTREFKPTAFHRGFNKSVTVERVWHSKEKDLLIIITKSKRQIEWASAKETSDEVWDLFVISYDSRSHLLFLNSSQKKASHRDLINAIGGKDATLISGETMFRAFSGITRLVFHNIGLYSRGTKLRFRMYAGLDVGEAINPVAQANSTKSNLFAVGYENGQRVSVGVSYKGRVWAMSSSSVPDWQQWCRQIGRKIIDPNISTDEYLKHTLIPKEIVQLPPDKEILSVILPVHWFTTAIEKARMFILEKECTLQNFEIRAFKLLSCNELSIFFGFDANQVFQFTATWGPEAGRFAIKQEGTDTLYISFAGPQIRFDEYLSENAPDILFGDGSELSGGYLLEANEVFQLTFDLDLIETIDWSGIDITKESKWKNGTLRQNSIQGRMIQHLLGSSSGQIIFDDDDSGEVADIVEVVERNDMVLFRFYHCKYSGGENPGVRVKDLYEVCGQAVRSVRWMNDPLHLVNQLQKRDTVAYRNGRATRFERGNTRDLLNLKRRLRKLRVAFEVVVVQPGITRSGLDPAIASVLGSANSFITEFTGSPLRLIASA